MQEADDLDVPPSLLCAINALTPRDSRTTHAFHAMVSNYSGPEAPQSIEYARGVIKEDEVVVEAIQRDFDERGDTSAISVAADRAGMLTRRLVQRLLDEDAQSWFRLGSLVRRILNSNILNECIFV